jgi:hypothetical protein
VKITVDVPDCEGLPVEIWLTLGKTGFEPHCVAFYDPEDARTVFDRWWRTKQNEAKQEVKRGKRKVRRRDGEGATTDSGNMNYPPG